MILSCPLDTTIIAALGETNATVSWDIPITSTTCTVGSINLTQTAGLASGSDFPIGQTTISYEATDGCNNVEVCSFTVNVQSAGTTLDLTCSLDITVTAAPGSTSAPVTWTAPITSTNCPGGNVNLIQTAGAASGSDFVIGTTTINYQATDDCGNIENCSFDITVLAESTGTYCASIGEQPWVEWIDNVTFGSINNNSNKEGYGDFTGQSTIVNLGSSYLINISHVFSWSQFDEHFRVWIDYNGDGDFLDDGEQVFEHIYQGGTSGSIPPLVTGNITIPTTAAIGSVSYTHLTLPTKA